MLRAALLLILLQISAAAFEDWQADGLKALEEKRYDAAIAIFTKASAADPKDYTAHFQLALAYSLVNRDAESIREYREVLNLKPGLYEAELNLGIVLLRDKQATEALPLLTSAATAKLAAFRPRYYEAEALLATGKFKEAVDAFTAAVKLDPKSAAAEAGLGRSLLKDQRIDDASEHLRKAAQMNPAYKDALLELGELYENNHKSAEAIALYEQFPDNGEAQRRTGMLLLDSGKTDEAIPHLEFAVKAAPNNENRMALASAFLKTKKTDQAFAILAQAIQTQPKNYDLRMMAGRALRDQRKFPEAAGQFFAASQLKPDSAEAWSELGGAFVMSEKYPEALAAFDKLKQLGAEKPGHFYLRAIVLDKLHQTKPALENYQKFLALSDGKSPDEEFKARQRARLLTRELSKK
jgi:tetratricopeptide (TPR) repeat protein